jgi:hypothetical protein
MVVGAVAGLFIKSAVVLAADPVFFLVGELPDAQIHYDSYILPLTDPTDIQHARDLISQGPGIGGTIIFADIAKGSDGINGDYIAPDTGPWSWHVTKFNGFGDFGIELLDGWPTFVEQDVDGWIANTNGQIGFWNYTVVRELSTVPEPAALGALGIIALLMRRARR